MTFMNDDFNVVERILCEDDACIGLVGPDGKCKVCGLVYKGPESVSALGRGEVVTDDGTPGGDADAASFSNGLRTESDDSDVDDRVLCSDDTCIGIIGPDGVCGTCGKTA
jgi:hypothetical protein